MNDQQLESIRNLRAKNQEFLEQIEHIYDKLKVEYLEYEDIIDTFHTEMHKMNIASSNEYVEPYCSAYYLIDNEFAVANGKCIKDPLYGTLNEGWGFLKKEYIESIESRYSNLLYELFKNIENTSNELEDILRQILAYNKVCIMFNGIDNLYNKLNESIKLRYTKEEVIQDLNLSTVLNKDILDSTFKLPVHLSLIIKYEPVIKTRGLHLNSLAILRDFLIELIYLLPFATIK